MYKSLKIFTLHLLKYSGIFAFAKYYYRNRPRIICYHGFNIEDEAAFIPGTFIKAETFKKRIELLKNIGSEFIPLEDIIKSHKLPSLPVILTFDDGFVSTLTEGLPILEENQIPATLYVTTYYHLKQNPIFRL
ncbi:MAG: peptidoglycan/xylan/chitin deacetylase (PgdA/CDA1 family), partial [Bacteriovoracaceae bacterium]